MQERIATGRSPTRGTPRPALGAPGFTLVELMVVVLIVALILGIGLPAFNAMSRDADRGKARQLLNGALQRANITALSDKNLTAVRLAPAEWITGQAERLATQVGGRQAIATYTQSIITDHPSKPRASFMDVPRFRQAADTAPILLPPSQWVAPLEALASGNDSDQLRDTHPEIGGSVVRGQIGLFAETAADSSTSSANPSFFDADDFLILFAADGTVVPSVTPSRVSSSAPIEPWRMNAYIPFTPATSGYVPEGGFEAPGRWRQNQERYNPEFTRNNFTGVVIYERQKMLSTGLNATTAAQMDARRNVLRSGLALYVNRVGGGLVQGDAQ